LVSKINRLYNDTVSNVAVQFWPVSRTHNQLWTIKVN